MKSILIFIFLFGHLTFYANKDRMSKPISFKFIYANNEIINLINPTELEVTKYSDEIIKHEKNLIEAKIVFDTGEELTFKYNGTNWTSITIKYKRKIIYIPNKIIEKIPEVNFQSIFLVWSNEKKKAFKANYFIIEFDIGKEKGKLTNLQISFDKRKYSSCVGLKQLSDGSTEWFEW